MPRRHTLPPQQIRIKPDQLSSSPPSPFKNILPDNNDKKSDNAGSKELDGGRYLHKKFKKVATLEEVPETAACGGDETFEHASGAGPEIDSAVAPAQGRYVCPYCAMPCAKPSVLQKHIRAHTNERPYPCRPCGFAFKTKSNLYKHCRSRSHTLKMDVADCCTNPSSEEDDSRHSSCPAAEDDDRPNSKNKIYKPKFHTLQGESSEGRDSSPSPDFLHYRINRLICEGDSELMDHPVPRQSWNPPRSSPLEKEDSPEIASPFPSKLALALLRPGTTSIDPQPLNLSQKESSACGGDPTHTIDGSIIKDILLRARSGFNGFKENTGCVECPNCKAVVDKLDIHLRVGCRAQLENSRHQQFSPVESDYDYAPVSSRTPEAHPLLIRTEKPPDLASLSRLPIDESRPVEAPPPLTRLTDLSVTPRIVDSSPSMGKSQECSTVLSKPSDSMPVLGRTSLVEPAEKKRKLSPRPACLPDLIPTTESPQKSIRLFGGQVKILDGPGGEARTLRIESGRESPPIRQESRDPKDRRVLTISNTGLHSVGLTVIQSDCEATRKPSESLNGKIAIPILSNIPRNLDPLTTITAYNPLTLPPRSSDVVQPLTIVHGGKPIPHVPGMPGPNSLLDPPSLIRKPLDQHATTPTHSIRQEPLQSLHVPPSVEDMLIRASVVSPIPITSTSPQPNTTESSEKKFVRPTWLPLKTGTFVAKKPLGALGLGPPPVALVSPETPRPRKSYGQLYLNGHAYTYLGLKCSSRMFFCTLNKPQPIYVPLSPEHATLSMYSNWKVVSESALSPLGLSPVCVMSSYDSRNRSSGFCQAGTAKCQVVHSSYSQSQSSPTSHLLASSHSQMKELQILEDEDPKRLKICNGGYESTEDYVYIRGRGRGKYVCEECGVRCCKPSMLKKHIRTTHSDLRPYSCKHCSFSFKTKGNLTKHMKSKAHYKQCIDLDISPVPTTVTDVNIDHESLARQNARCKELGADIEGSSEETEEEDEEEELPESEDEEGKIEREAAASLLSLSEVAQQSALKDYANLGLISTLARPLTYPYSLPTVIRKSSTSDRDDNQDEPLELTASSQSSHSSDITTPIDLSNKTTSEGSIKSFETDTSMLSMLSTPIATLSALSPVLPSPLGTPSVISDEGCALMTAYLKEKAARDTLMKQQQYRSNSSSLRISLTEERCLMLDSPTISISERNRSPMAISSMSVDSRPVDCRFPARSEGFHPVEKNTSSDSGRPVAEKQQVDSHNQPFESKKLLADSHIRPIESHKLLIESHRSIDSHNQLVDSQNRPVDIQRMPLKIVSRPIDVIVRPMEQIRPESQENMGASTSDSEAMEVDVESMDQSPVDPRDKRSEECQTPTAAVPSVSVNHSAKESALGILALTSSQAAKTPASILPPQSKLKAEFLPPTSGPNYINVLEEGRSICAICQKVFTKPSQLRLHVNIHYFERPFRCDACGVSFRTKGHLQKHQRSISHLNKVNMNSTFGTATMSNPRPFKCTDCKIAFRIHGHLAKHLRSKMHIMRLECLGKLPFGMYAELERSGLNIHDIDTTDCHNSLESLQLLARKLHENDPTKLGQWAAPVEMMGQGGMDGGAMDLPASAGETSSDEDEPSPASFSQLTASHSIQR